MTAPRSCPPPSRSASSVAPATETSTVVHVPTVSRVSTVPEPVVPDHGRALLLGALLPATAVAAVTVPTAAVLGDGRAALGALVGVVLVVLFSGTGLWMLRLARAADPVLVLVVALGSYAGRVVLFGVAVVVLETVGTDEVLNRNALLVAVLLTVTAWLAGEIRAFTRLRVPVFDVSLPSAPPGGEDANKEGR